MIGAGQAGLSVGYHVRRRGFVPLGADTGAERTFVVLDQNPAPGGAWQHRWESLRMATVNGIHELPGMPVPALDPRESSRDALPPYFAEYERRFDLRVERPVTVRSVERVDDDPHGRLCVTADDGRVWLARYVINATGTWTAPYVPAVPGVASFRGRTLHVHDYISASEFAGRRVAIVGAGISAVQLLDEISHVADTFWVTRAPVDFTDEAFDEPARIAAIAGVEERVRQGLPVGSVIAVTGQHGTPWARSAHDRGVLVRHPMFTSIEPGGVRMPDGPSNRSMRSCGRRGSGPRSASSRRSGCARPQVESGSSAGARSTSRGCSSSATGPHNRRSAPTARAATPCARSWPSSTGRSPGSAGGVRGAFGRRIALRSQHPSRILRPKRYSAT